ncbi:HlyD family efflux transporter periplasmic adaptor subunit [Sphingobacterium siyangense]|uniref:HlyD family secretion protein n=1 Tax=Sphingobacterium TaxID=28453 RepID=UPI000B494667|nr:MULTISPECIES: HlyD family efflux transporter periplasmic adaptor subunit [Sphingobacterium]UQA73355.1 HlyD family efflux transporter periplasmic adaptor subunit [Sphingobacterium siyangense]
MEDLHKVKKTEELDHIVNRMPKKFGVQITIIVMVSIFLLLIFGYLITYPDVQSGTVSINTENPAVKVVSPASGKLILQKENQQEVLKGDIIGYLENPANMGDILLVNKLVEGIDINDRFSLINLSLPGKVYLGAINNKYYALLDALQQYKNYYNNKTLDHQLRTYNELLNEQKNILSTSRKKAELSHNSTSYIENFAKRDSILLEKKVISVAEFERNKINHINAAYTEVNTKAEASQVMLELFRTQNAITETQIKKDEVEKSLTLQLTSSYHELSMALKSFEENYIFRSPRDGILQYLNFWNDDYFIRSGEAVFSIVPADSKIVAHVRLPNSGAGKVLKGQEVIIKLDNFPYNEYGSLRGVVQEISLMTNIQQTSQGDLEQYLIYVELPDGLKTNYAQRLQFKYELKGVAEIITRDRRLIERIFDNLKYMLSKKNNGYST